MEFSYTDNVKEFFVLDPSNKFKQIVIKSYSTCTSWKITLRVLEHCSNIDFMNFNFLIEAKIILKLS